MRLSALAESYATCWCMARAEFCAMIRDPLHYVHEFVKALYGILFVVSCKHCDAPILSVSQKILDSSAEAAPHFRGHMSMSLLCSLFIADSLTSSAFTCGLFLVREAHTLRLSPDFSPCSMLTNWLALMTHCTFNGPSYPKTAPGFRKLGG